MNWNDLRLVLSVARSGSLSGAGRDLKINHTTAGRRLSALERHLGVKLFIRGRPAFIVTEAGAAAIAHAERMETEALAFAGRINAKSMRPQGLVRVATMPWIVTSLIVPALPDFTARFPEIEIETIGDVRERSLSKREAEIALRFEMEPRSRERAAFLAAIPYALYGPVRVPAKDLPWIAFGEDVAASLPAQWIEQMRGESGRVSLRAHDAGFIHAAIRAGVGKGLIPELLGEGDPALVRLSGCKPEVLRQLRVMVHEDMQQLTRTLTVIEWLKSVIEDRLAATAKRKKKRRRAAG